MRSVECLQAEQPVLAGASAPMPIAVCVGSWLPPSETFIYDQLSCQLLTRAHVFATSRTDHANNFPYEPLTVLQPLQAIGYRYTGRCKRLERALAASGVRLVFAHFGLNGAFSMPFAKRLGLPLVVMFHGHDVGGLLPQNRFTLRYARYQMLAQQLFAYASLLVCASEELAAVLLGLGAPEGKLRVHRLGIDLSRFSPIDMDEQSAAPTVLMVGRLVEKKGMNDGLAAFALMQKHHPQARLMIVGGGPLRRVLVEQAMALGISDAVQFLGPCTHSDVSRHMRAAHVLMTPSVTTKSGDRESGVIVIKEAAASGIPTIGTRHGGIPEIIEHERTGLLVPERSPGELAAGLHRLLSDSALRRQMGLQARAKMAREYDQRTQAMALEKMLVNVGRG